MTTTECRICRKDMNPFPMGEKNDYKLVACQSCGSVVTNPWPTTAELDTFYGDVQPEIVHLPNPDREIIFFSKLIKKITSGVTGKRFLDVCARQGYAVTAAKNLGLQPKGIDSHDFFVKFAKDKYEVALFEHVSVVDYAVRGEQADIILCVEGFCEQPDPDAYAAALAKILAPNGVIYLHEPDGNHWHLPRTFTRWAFVEPPINFSYISETGMRALLDRHGLKVRKKFWSWQPFMSLIIIKK